MASGAAQVGNRGWKEPTADERAQHQGRTVSGVANDTEQGRLAPMRPPSTGTGPQLRWAATGTICEHRPLRPSPRRGSPCPLSPGASPKARYSGPRKAERSAWLETTCGTTLAARAQPGQGPGWKDEPRPHSRACQPQAELGGDCRVTTGGRASLTLLAATPSPEGTQTLGP